MAEVNATSAAATESMVRCVGLILCKRCHSLQAVPIFRSSVFHSFHDSVPPSHPPPSVCPFHLPKSSDELQQALLRGRFLSCQSLTRHSSLVTHHHSSALVCLFLACLTPLPALRCLYSAFHSFIHFILPLGHPRAAVPHPVLRAAAGTRARRGGCESACVGGDHASRRRCCCSREERVATALPVALQQPSSSPSLAFKLVASTAAVLWWSACVHACKHAIIHTRFLWWRCTPTPHLRLRLRPPPTPYLAPLWWRQQH